MVTVKNIATCTGHRAAIYALAPGKDDRHFLTAGGDGFVVEWNLDDPETGKVVATTEGQIFSLFNLRTFQKILAGNMTGGVHWIDRSDSTQTRNIQHHLNKGVFDIKSDGKWIFTAGGDGVLTRWNPETGRIAESLKLSAKALRSIAVSPELEKIAVGASDEAIYILDAQTLALERTLPHAHANSVFAVEFSPDGRFLISGGRDAMLRVWDLDNAFALLSEQAAHLFTINHIAVSPDGNLMATASRDKSLKIWDLKNHRLLKVVEAVPHFGHLNSVNRLLWLPGGLISCSDDRTAKIWQVERAPNTPKNDFFEATA